MGRVPHCSSALRRLRSDVSTHTVPNSWQRYPVLVGCGPLTEASRWQWRRRLRRCHTPLKRRSVAAKFRLSCCPDIGLTSPPPPPSPLTRRAVCPSPRTGTAVPTCCTPPTPPPVHSFTHTRFSLSVVALFAWFVRCVCVCVSCSCPNEDACVVNASAASVSCAEGHEGPLCAVCSAGFGQSGTSCSKCTSDGIAWLLLLATVIAVSVVVLVAIIRVLRTKNTVLLPGGSNRVSPCVFFCCGHGCY